MTQKERQKMKKTELNEADGIFKSELYLENLNFSNVLWIFQQLRLCSG